MQIVTLCVKLCYKSS